jgi:hypothetical protein
MTISLVQKPEARAIVREPCVKKSGGYRSRGWTPLKYPKSALLQDDDSFVYFPLHRDVLLATVRELLILDGALESKTLKVSNNSAKFLLNDKVVSIPYYKRHLDGPCWPRSAEIRETIEDSSASATRKRKKQQQQQQQQQSLRLKKAKTKSTDAALVTVSHDEAVFVEYKHPTAPSAEEIASEILRRTRFEGSIAGENDNDILPLVAGQTTKRPRFVSEADQTPLDQIVPRYGNENSQYTSNINDGMDSQESGDSQEISEVLDLGKRNQNGAFAWRASSPGCMSELLHSSISNEALLRDAAMTLTEHLIESFSDGAVKMFFGYKSPSVSREQLTQLLAGLLFDISHAMFAWEQTEQEILATAPDTANDEYIQKSLFDQRALKKIGGFDPCSMLPHAISIARLRRRKKSSWESFAATARGQKMLAHHAHSKTAISVGKRRRGHRLRQRYWLTSAYNISSENDGDMSHCTGTTRSRSCSFASSEGDEDDTLPGLVDRRSRLLQDNPCSKAINLRKSPGASWGVCLVKEGDDCLVGRASEVVDGLESDRHLRCGDMILYVRNDRGDEASSRLCAWLAPELAGQDCYRTVVDLFKKSEELQLVVQRV